MYSTCFDKAFGGSPVNHRLLRPAWPRAMYCLQNPVASACHEPASWLAGFRQLAGRGPAHPLARHNNSNRDAENSWPRGYIKKPMNTTIGREVMMGSSARIRSGRAHSVSILMTRNFPTLLRST